MLLEMLTEHKLEDLCTLYSERSIVNLWEKSEIEAKHWDFSAASHGEARVVVKTQGKTT